MLFVYATTNSTTKLNILFARYSDDEMLKLTCSYDRCDNGIEVTKSKKLYNAPKLLVIQFQRMIVSKDENNNYTQWKMKCKTLIPTRGIDLSSYLFRGRGVSRKVVQTKKSNGRNKKKNNERKDDNKKKEPFVFLTWFI